MPISQRNLPIVIILQGGELFAEFFPLPFIFGPGGIIRPEAWQLIRPSRGTVVHTAEDAFLEDYGPGVPTLLLSGHTGWDNPTGLAGIVAFQLLEAMFQEYLRRRKRNAAAGFDPDNVRLIYLDTLNIQAFLVYPQEFHAEKSKRNALLYYYRLRFTVLVDLKYEGLYGIADLPFANPVGLLNNVSAGFGGLLA